METITYKKKSYPVKSYNGVNFSTVALENAIMNEDKDDFDSPKGEQIDSTIGYYFEEDEFKLPLKELYKIFKTS